MIRPLLLISLAVFHSLVAIVVLPYCLPQCIPTSPRRLEAPPRQRADSDPIRFAWGIMTAPEDIELRSVLRQTYLKSDPRICTLSFSMPKRCQIAYTFVIDSDKELPNEEDITYMPSSRARTRLASWFQSAIELNVDFVAKVDPSIIVIPSRFLEFVDETLSSPQLRLVYGGSPRDRWECGGIRKWKCREMVGNHFMSPELVFLSTDLAHSIPDHMGDDPLPLSNWVFHLPVPVMHATIQSAHGLWEQGPTVPHQYAERWEYLQQHRFAKNLLKEYKFVPRYNGMSMLDEVYRRVPWSWIPNVLTRWNLP